MRLSGDRVQFVIFSCEAGMFKLQDLYFIAMEDSDVELFEDDTC